MNHLNKLTDQFFDHPERYRDKTRQRVYLKDIDCPEVWQDKLKDHIPPSLFYLNDGTGEVDGTGTLGDSIRRKRQDIRRSGDLMSSLPPDMRAENLMCYIGHEGTYTPSHREMCASLGQNIMVDASKEIGEDGSPERPGSSLWFMTEMKDRHLVSEYWLSVLGHDIEVENHFAQLIAWRKAPFKTYVVEQRPGDFILIPPLAPHQVWNRGTRTMKIAWNRTTVETLELAMSEALPNSRVVCRDEQYKTKAIVYYTLLKYSQLIKSARAQVEAGGEQAEATQHSVKVRQVQRDFKRLFDLYKSIMLSEMFSQNSREHCEFLPYDSNVTCSYCRCNIFNRFLSCKTCKNLFSSEIDEPYDVCMDCYCMGRSCGCQSGYQWVEQWKWKNLVDKYEEWRAQVIDIDGLMTEKTPLSLQEERRYLGKKTMAQVCQEQLEIRPFVDIKAPKVDDHSEDEEIEVSTNGVPKKVKNKKSKRWLETHKPCHTCLRRHPSWKMAFCSNCDLAFCYGTLFRAHDMMPLSVMESFSWKCPHCRRVCNTGSCRRDLRQHPYEPKGTLLGHDTKKVADPRSVECLVDFSMSNLIWIREEEGRGQSAMQRRLQQAEQDRLADPSLDPRYMDEDTTYVRNGITYSPIEDTNENGDDFVDINVVQNDDSNGFYPDPDLDRDIPRLGQKRGHNDDEDEHGNRRKKKQTTKKGEDQLRKPKSVPSKQYQKETQHRLLDEAERDNRSILVAARMQGKSKVVRLFLDPQILESIRNRPVSKHPAAAVWRQTPKRDNQRGNVGSILQSDVIPKANVTRNIKKEKVTKVVRRRVEPDKSNATKKRHSVTDETTKMPGGSRGSGRYEEVTLDSDEEFFNNDDGTDNASPKRTRTRASNWLARKNQDEIRKLRTELPANTKNVNVRPARQRAEKRRSMPAKLQPGIGSTGQTLKNHRNTTGNTSAQPNNEDTLYKEEDQSSEAPVFGQQAAAALEAQQCEEETQWRVENERGRAAAAERAAQENLRANMVLYKSGIEEPQPIHPSLPPATNSLLSRSGTNGKKAKFVSTGSKRNSENCILTTPATVTAPVPTFTSVNKRPEPVDSSDSDSVDEIPANAPIPKKPVAQPRTVPTRGGGPPKHGMWRPRKTM